MQFNVSQLLKSSPGTERRYTFEEEERRYEELTADVQGTVRMMRTDRGILVMAQIETDVECTCSRCLTRFAKALQFNLEEEYFPTVDIVSGVRVEPPSESFTTDAHHILDLGEGVRQYVVMFTPMKPLCREDCAGLCSTCGADLNRGKCGCPAAQRDPRWSQLAALRTQVPQAR